MSYRRGDTARVSASITDINNTAVDPDELIFRVLTPAGVTIVHEYDPEVEGDIVRDAKGDYHIDVPLDEVGDWPYRWEGTGGVGLAEEGVLTVVGGAFDVSSSEILTLSAYKMRRKLTEASKERDEAIEAAIASAEDAVLKYTQRDFTMAQEIETKTYMYDGSGILEADDFVDLTAISVEGSALATTNFMPGPREGETYYWLDFTAVPRQSPQMGLARNLDRSFECPSDHHGRQYAKVDITAKFGWPGGAPASVKQAVTWLVDEFVATQGTRGDVQAEAIADLSYVYQRISEESALPARILALLEPYRRLSL